MYLFNDWTDHPSEWDSAALGVAAAEWLRELARTNPRRAVELIAEALTEQPDSGLLEMADAVFDEDAGRLFDLVTTAFGDYFEDDITAVWEDANPNARPDCHRCGGSGGGLPPMTCPHCGGSGKEPC